MARRSTGAKRVASPVDGQSTNVSAHTHKQRPTSEIAEAMATQEVVEEQSSDFVHHSPSQGLLAGYLVVRHQLIETTGRQLESLTAELNGFDYHSGTMQRFRRERSIFINAMDEATHFNNLTPAVQVAVKTIFRAVGVIEVHLAGQVVIIRNPDTPYEEDKQHISRGLWAPITERDRMSKLDAARRSYDAIVYEDGGPNKEDQEEQARRQGKNFY